MLLTHEDTIFDSELAETRTTRDILLCSEHLIEAPVEAVKRDLRATGVPHSPDTDPGPGLGERALGDEWPLLSPEALRGAGTELDGYTTLQTHAGQFHFLGAVLQIFTDPEFPLGSALHKEEEAVIPLLTELARARAVGVSDKYAQRLLVERFLEGWKQFTKASA